MDWMNAIGNIVNRYSGEGGGTAAAPSNPHEDFQQVAQSAPKDVVAGGLSQAFRSDQTPPFPQMLSSVFGQSDPNQRAGLLSRLIAAAGPGAVSGLPGLGGLSSSPAGGRITPEQAAQVTPGQVQQLATQAERQNPSIIDEVSHFYAQHPQVVKAIGGLALSIAIQHMVRR